MQRFFRIVRNNPPTREDFKSHRELGRPLFNPTPEKRRLWEGVSVFAEEAEARRTARDFPKIGSYIVELRVPEGGPIRTVRTGSGSHHTLWADPDDLLACVVGEARSL